MFPSLQCIKVTFFIDKVNQAFGSNMPMRQPTYDDSNEPLNSSGRSRLEGLVDPIEDFTEFEIYVARKLTSNDCTLSKNLIFTNIESNNVTNKAIIFR